MTEKIPSIILLSLGAYLFWGWLQTLPHAGSFEVSSSRATATVVMGLPCLILSVAFTIGGIKLWKRRK